MTMPETNTNEVFEMKKTIAFIAAFIMMFTLAACNTTNNENDAINRISESLDIEISQESVVENKDVENEFITLKITDEKTIDEIKSEWKELPLTENLTALIYGLEDEASSIGPYITNDNQPLFPQIENGYYYFYDRNSKSTDNFDDTEILNRNSFNVTIAIFDMDTNKLHYCEFDT